MKNYGCSGYVVKASALIKLFPPDKQEEYNKLVVKNEWGEKIDEFFRDNFLHYYPRPYGILEVNDETESEDLESGETYVIFNESDLFEKTPRKELQSLLKKGITPEFSNWVIWG